MTDPLMIFGTAGLGLALMLMAATQALKETFGLSGKWATMIAIGLGMLLGVFGLRATAASVLPDAPGLLGALILGAFLGLIASGGYKLIGSFQEYGAALKARNTPTPQVQVSLDAPAPVCPPAVSGSEGDPRGAEIVPLGLAGLPADAPEPALTHPVFSLQDD